MFSRFLEPSGLRRGGIRAAMLATVVAIGAQMGGCKAGESQQTIRALTDRNQALVQQLDESNSQVKIAQSALARRDKTISDQRNLIAQLRSVNLQNEQDLRQFDETLRNMTFSQLDPRTDAELRKFAGENPELVTYDGDLGMLRFKSDLTFDSGSDAVKSGAKTTLSSLAKVLTSDIAKRYDIRVVGHTDNQPISSATARRHPTNMHLSCHRAIAVRNQLVSLGVDPARIEAAGRGEFDPLVPNNAKGGTPANRRVEIFLVRSLGEGSPAAEASATDKTKKTEQAGVDTQSTDIMK